MVFAFLHGGLTTDGDIIKSMNNSKSLKRLFFVILGKNKRQQVGSIFILSALFLLFYIYYPLIQLFIPQKISDVNAASRIEIPKIKVVAPIIWDVDPFDSKIYHEALTRGVAQARGTSYPGESGTTYLFAHSSDFPWRITRYNVIFYRLGELTPGDKIFVTRNSHRYIYKVVELKTVWPNDIQYLTKSKKTQLIVQTCTPVGTDWQRLLVFADPI